MPCEDRSVKVLLPLPDVAFDTTEVAVPWRLLIGYAGFQFAMQFTLLFSGMKLGFPPGLASLVVQLQAFFSIGLAVMLLDERPMKAQLLGALIAFGGMGVVAMHLQATATIIGFVLVIAAAFCWGVGNIFTKRMGKVDALALVVWGSLLAAPPLLAASLLIEGPQAIASALTQLSWMSVVAVLFQSYPTTILGFGIWSVLMRRYPTATIAPFSLLVPVAGMVSAAVVLGEPLQWWKIAAGMLVLCGLALNQFGGLMLNRLAK